MNELSNSRPSTMSLSSVAGGSPASSNFLPLVFGNGESVLRHVRSYTKSLFDEEQRVVFTGLSDPYKDQWGNLFGHDDRLVVVKSPYDVPMGPERSMWMNKFTQLRKMNRLDLMPHLIYDVQDEGFELVSPVDLVPPDEFLSNGGGGIATAPNGDTESKRPVEAYDLLSLEASSVNKELVPPQKEAPEAAAASSDADLPAAGTRIRVYWPDDKAWYDGTIDENSGAVSHVTYDDGDEHWIRLADETYKLLDESGSPQKKSATPKRVKKVAKKKPAKSPNGSSVANGLHEQHELEDTDADDTAAPSFATPPRKRRRAGDDEIFSPGGDSTYAETTDGSVGGDDSPYRRPAKEPRKLRNGKFVATDAKPDGYEWCDALGLWRENADVSDEDSLPTEREDDDEMHLTDQGGMGFEKDGMKAIVVDHGGNSFAHALLEEKTNWKMRRAYAKLGTMIALTDACPPADPDSSAKKIPPAAAPVKSLEDDAPVAAPVKCKDEGSPPASPVMSKGSPLASPVKSKGSPVASSVKSKGSPVASSVKSKGAPATSPVKSNDIIKGEDSVASEDEVKVVSVTQGVPSTVRHKPPPLRLPPPPPLTSNGPEPSRTAIQSIHRVKQALEWEIVFDDNEVDGATLNRLRELLETLQSVHMTVELLRETSVNVSLVHLKSELASRKSVATKPLLKLAKHILGNWKETYELSKHGHNNKVRSRAIKSDG